jgi:aldose sugar dehydrogenase
LDFDPVSGNLWDTENGPAFGDEINLVKPGFNSGYARVQGIWPITNYTELFNNPPPGLPKGYYFKNSTLGDIDFEKIKNFNGKGKYSNPEFSWNHTVGVTSIKFYNSDKLGKKYENDLFVGDAFGSIYHFDLNQNRTGLNLNGSLSDKVANSDDELHDVLFAQGLAPRGITDMEVGPDGYLYVLLYGANGSIYKIIPK